MTRSRREQRELQLGVDVDGIKRPRPRGRTTRARILDLLAVGDAQEHGILAAAGPRARSTLLALHRDGLVTITTLGHPDSFDNAYYNHTYRLTDRGRVELRALAVQERRSH